MKRPIVIVAIGYLIGIIMGLYLKISIVFLYALLLPIVLIIKFIKAFIRKKKAKESFKFNMFYIPRYFRYLKLILNFKVLILIVIVSIISNSIILVKEKRYDTLYEKLDKIEITGIIVDVDEINKSNYKSTYKVKVLSVNGSDKFKNTYIILNVNKKKKINIQYGNKVIVKGEYKEPERARNYGGFNYKEYLKQLDVYGIVNASNVEILEGKFLSKVEYVIYDLKSNIKEHAKKYIDKEAYPIFMGLILGDTSNLNDDIKEQFKNANISHVLAISGMHISCIIIGCSIVLNKLIGKRFSKIFTILVLVFYLLLTGFSASTIRAGIAGILVILGKVIHRKSDIWTSMAISILITLIYNPYLIQNVGLQFSYIGTIGIILLNKSISKLINKRKSKIKEILVVCISAQIAILPLSIFHFNTIGIYFLLTNLLLSLIIGPTVIISFVFLIIILIPIFNLVFLSNVIGFLINILIKIILLISNFSFLPFSKIYIKTPTIFTIVSFYMLVSTINLIYSVKTKESVNGTELRIKYLIEVVKYKFRKNKKRILLIIVISSIFVSLLKFVIIKSDLNIHFVDVGQGDCCFIETPNKRTILIDGGGSETSGYDIGKNTLIPYILDRGYTKIDYIIISHFDTDHVGGILTVMEELEVGEVIISKQVEDSENYRRFKEIVKEKRIKVIIVGEGDNLQIEKDLYFDILWPNNEKLITENILNNNSIVCKMNYKNFSMLFTGDIEETAEKEILKEYKNDLHILRSTILKVGHHGSKTSSTQVLLEVVKPKIALIGVGENNKFGHPNDDVLKRLKKIGSRIYRTDKMGEISIALDNKGRIRIEKIMDSKKCSR